MSIPNQKTILLEQAYEEIKEICTKFQNDSGASDIEVKTLTAEGKKCDVCWKIRKGKCERHG